MNLTFCCSCDNDLYSLFRKMGIDCPRFARPIEAVDHAPAGSGVLILADAYPKSPVCLDGSFYDRVTEKNLRLFVEYPSFISGMRVGEPMTTTWERAVVATDRFEPSLAKHQILVAHDCRFLPVSVVDPLVVLARVAGFDQAVYGLPDRVSPILFQIPQSQTLVATTGLSRFITGRYGPHHAWKHLWEGILSFLDPQSCVSLDWTPDVRPTFRSDALVPENTEVATIKRAAQWVFDSKLLIHSSDAPKIEKLLRAGEEIMVDEDSPVGDGSFGILEGYASGIRYDGKQVNKRLPIRADCNTSTAMVLAMNGLVNGDERSRSVARHLLDFVYFKSDMHSGVRGDPAHPAFGHLAWGAFAPNWQVANYGVDYASAVLSTKLASAARKTDRYDEAMMKVLLANLRTTGTLGFRGQRVDIPELEEKGWRYFADRATTQDNTAYESHTWATNLWAYKHTGYRPFLDVTKKAMESTLEEKGENRCWIATDEPARLLLPLAWLLRLEDSQRHRRWLRLVTDHILDLQQPCGAIQERCLEKRADNFNPALSNEQYGTGETTIIQKNGDPACDQLYQTGYTLLGLRESVFVTGDPKLKQAEDRLADFLCRIQIASPKHPELDGWWFRAFDYRQWEYWGAAGDVGWGAWCLETGWGPALTCGVLGLRVLKTSLWDFTAASQIGRCFEPVQKLMARNDGGPWRKV